MQQYGAPRGQKTAARAGEGGGVRGARRPTGTEDSTSRGSGRVSRLNLSRGVGQSRSVTWLPWRRRLPCRCWPARQAKPKYAIETKKALEEEERRRKVEEAVARLRAKVHAGEPLSAAEHEAWYGTSSSSTGKRRKKKKRKRRKLPKAPLPRCGRPCNLQRQVPAVPRQNGGHSCCAAETGTHSVLLGPDAVLGQGRCARVAQRQGYGQTVQKTALVPQLQFIEGRRPPFVSQRQIPSVLPVQKTVETPQFQSVRWSVPLLCRSSFRVQAWRRQPSSHIAVVELWTRSLKCPCVQRQVPVAQFNKVVDVAVFMQRQVLGSAGRCLRAVHRQDVQVLRRGVFAGSILRPFSHSVRLDVSAHFSALDDEEFFVVEGSGWRGRRESDSQVFCHPNSMHALAHIDRDM